MSNGQPDPSPASPPPPHGGGWSIPALFIGVAVTLVMTVYPFAAAKTGGAPDMLAASLLFWAMSAGFVRGLGFIPRLLVLRWLLSLPASLIALAAAIWRLASN
jgi:predicted membrane protein